MQIKLIKIRIAILKVQNINNKRKSGGKHDDTANHCGCREREREREPHFTE